MSKSERILEREKELRLEKIKIQQLNVYIAYLLWFFLGGFGVHRIYSKQKKWWLFLVLTILGWITSFFIIGFGILLGVFVWWIIDGINLHKVIQKYNTELINSYLNEFDNEIKEKKDLIEE